LDIVRFLLRTFKKYPLSILDYFFRITPHAQATFHIILGFNKPFS
jgi:hypothetical protein